jgi:ribosomal protein S18 acetylase RimI-like enzyme
MTRHAVRQLESGDFATLMALEERIFAGAGEAVLGPYYVRLVCEFYRETCFLAEVDDQAVGYLLCFVREREAYCTTLGVLPAYQGSRVAYYLLRTLIGVLADRVDSCWFTVSPDNTAARALHRSLGASEVDLRRDFYGAGDERIVSCIDRCGFERLRARYERLGLLAPASRPAAAADAAALDQVA